MSAKKTNKPSKTMHSNGKNVLNMKKKAIMEWGRIKSIFFKKKETTRMVVSIIILIKSIEGERK